MQGHLPDPGSPRNDDPRKHLLALDPALGTVYQCGHCEHIHFAIGDLHFKTDLAGFQRLLVLFNRAAANFELWAERNGSVH